MSLTIELHLWQIISILILLFIQIRYNVDYNIRKRIAIADHMRYLDLLFRYKHVRYLSYEDFKTAEGNMFKIWKWTPKQYLTPEIYELLKNYL